MSDNENRPLAVFYAYDEMDVEKFSHIDGTIALLYDIENRLRSDEKWKELPEAVYDYVVKLREFISETKSSYHLPEDM